MGIKNMHEIWIRWLAKRKFKMLFGNTKKKNTKGAFGNAKHNR